LTVLYLIVADNVIDIHLYSVEFIVLK